MAQYNFVGAIENISERQLEYINNVINELGFANSKVLFETVGIPGDNYAASIKRIILNEDKGSLNIIAKIAPTDEIVRQAMSTYVLFKNEHVMYTEVLPKLVQLQQEEDIPEKEQLRYAKCYGSLSEPPNEVVILEDLKSSDFTMLDRFVSLSDECVRSVLRNFALLHSMSYVLKLKEPETFNNFAENLNDMWLLIAGTNEIKMFFQGIENDTLTILDNPGYANLIKHTISQTIDHLVKLAKADRNNKHSIIQQGDAWTNNVMFKFEEERLSASILIDYQVSKVTSPVADIMYMIFNCTDHETRKQHFYDWIDYYHLELEKSLSNYNIKVNFVYPRDKLDVDLKRYAKLMFGFSVLLATMLIRKSDDAAKIMEAMQTINETNFEAQSKEFNVSQLDEESVSRFRKRVVGLIDSYTTFGLM